MNVELGGHLSGRAPAGPPEVLRQALDTVGCPDAPHCGCGERLASARTKPAGIEGSSDLSIRLFRSQRTDHLHYAGGCPPQIGSTQRQGSFQLSRGAALPADLDSDYLLAYKSHILDEQPEHPFAFPGRRSRIVPHTRQIGYQLLNALPVLGAHDRRLGLGRPGVLLLSLGELPQSVVPLSLEAICHKPVFGTHEHVLLLRKLRLLSGSLDLSAVQAIDLGLASTQLLEDLQGYLD